MIKVIYLFIVTGLLTAFFSCSLNPQAPANQSANNNSILIADEKNNMIYQLNLNSGSASSFISSGISSQPIDLNVEGNFLYVLQSSANPCSIQKYDLSTGKLSGSVPLNYGSAQQMSSDGNNLYVCDLGGNVTVVSLSGFSVSGSKSFSGQAVQGIFYTNGEVYAGVSGGYPSYNNSQIAVLAVSNIAGAPAYYNTLPNPVCFTTDGEGAIFIACAGTENSTTYNYNNDGGILKFSGSSITNIITNKSYAAGGVDNEIQYYNGLIFAAENTYATGNTGGIDVYQPNGTFVTNILPGVTINCIIVYEGTLFAEGNNGKSSLYQINISNYSIIKTYQLSAAYSDAWGCAMAVY